MARGVDNNPPARVYQRLFDALGPQQWWPAETAFDVLVGAVLTQNAAWRNVEQAIDRLEAASLQTPEAILAAPLALLKDCLRPSGYYNVKTQRLRAACEAWVALGGEAHIREMDTGELRSRLLEVNGLGPESVDDVLLYGLQRPVFVVDAYTRRIFSRLGAVSERIAYDPLQAYFHAHLSADVTRFAQYHAYIVTVGKDYCRPRFPRCADCPLVELCDYGRAAA